MGSRRYVDRGNRLDAIILAHAGGLDEFAIFLFPAFVGFGVWLLTRQPNPPEKKLGTHPSDRDV